MTKRIMSLALAGFIAAGAVSAGAQTPGGKVLMARASPMAGIPFVEPPQVLDDDGTFADYMGTVARDLGRKCGALEAYGWQMKPGDQAFLDRIHTGTMDAFKKEGYTAKVVNPASVANPADNAVYTVDKKDKRLVALWSTAPDAVMLLLCDAGAK